MPPGLGTDVWRQRAEGLWQLLDDIDTMDDAASRHQDSDVVFRRAVRELAKKRLELAGAPDGQALVWRDPEPCVSSPVLNQHAAVTGWFRRRPAAVVATRWFKNGDHPCDYERSRDGLRNGEMWTYTAAERKRNGWEGAVVRYYRSPEVAGHQPCTHCSRLMHDHGWIDTSEGGYVVCPGDWIVTGAVGEHYPVPDAVFRATHEPVAFG